MPTGKSSKITQEEIPRRRAVTPGSRPQRRGSEQTTSDARRNRREGRRCASSKPITTTQGEPASWVAPSFEASSRAAEGQLARIHARRSAPRERRPPVPERGPGIAATSPPCQTARGRQREAAPRKVPSNRSAPPSSRMAGRNRLLCTARRIAGDQAARNQPRRHDQRGTREGRAPAGGRGPRARGPHKRGPRHHAGDGALPARKCPSLVSDVLLSHGLLRSTIGARGLNFRVRNGTGCTSPAMVADQRGAFGFQGPGLARCPGGRTALASPNRRSPDRD